MPKFVIERTLPGAGRLSPNELREIAQKSNSVLRELGTDIQWVHSYVVENKLFCVYNAKSADLVREHGKCGGFPVDAVHEVKHVFDPVSAEA